MKQVLDWNCFHTSVLQNERTMDKNNIQLSIFDLIRMKYNYN